MFGIDAVVSEAFQKFFGDVTVMLEEVVNSFEKLVRKRLHFRSDVDVGVEGESAVFGFFVVGVEVDAGDLIALSDDGTYNHSFVLAFLVDENGHFIELSFVHIVLFSFLGTFWFVFIVAEVGGRLDVGEQSDFVLSCGFAEFNEDIVSLDGPSFFFEVSGVCGEIGEVAFFGFDFLF